MAQPIIDSTGNLINDSNWTGIGARAADPNNCCSNPAGSQPLYDTSSNTIKFSYGQATVQQSIAVNSALASAGTGIQVSGYSWGYSVRNMNGHGGQGGTDTLTANTWLTNSAGQNVASSTVTYNTQFDWTTVTGSRTLSSTVAPSTLGSVGISFSGKDSGFWAGLYGPEVKNVNLRLNYGVDPCATNPAYSTSCAGFSSIIDSTNLVPNPNGYASSGSTIDNSYSINQALSAAGSGITIHGFKWGYVANANGSYCNAWNLFGLCLFGQDITPSVSTSVSITSNTGATLYSVDRTYTNSYNTTSYSYLFPSSRQVTTLGSFNFTGSTNDQAYLGSMWSKAIYTPDPCMQDPLSSPTCKGYVDAMTKYLASLQPPATVASTTTVVAETPTSTVSTTTVADPVPVVTTTTTSTVGTVSSSPTVVASPVATTTTTSSTTTSSSSQSSKESSGSSNNTSLALSIISKNSERDAAGAAVAQTAMTQAAAAATQAQQEATAVAQTAVANSTSSNTLAMGGPSMNGTGIKVNNDSSLTFQSNSITIASINMSNQSYSVSATQLSGLGLASVVVQMEQAQTRQEVISSSAIQSSNETYTLLPSNALTDRSNPLNDSMEQKQVLPPSNMPTFTGPVVNKNAQDNEIAGGVNINRMALAPTGYGDYLNFTLRDAAFYAPKEVYRNQKNVDNARALRQLTNDTRHQEMVEQQYRR